MSVKLLPEQHLPFLRFSDLYKSLYASNEAVQARPSLHLSKCHIVGIHMSWLIYACLEDLGEDCPSQPSYTDYLLTILIRPDVLFVKDTRSVTMNIFRKKILFFLNNL